MPFAVTMRVTALILIAILAASLLVWAVEPGQTRQDIIRLLEAQRTALLQGDADALERIWADDYVIVDGSGRRLSGQQRLDQLRSGELVYDELAIEPGLEIRYYQDVAIVVGVLRGSTRENAQTIGGPYRTTEVLLRANDQWRIVSTQLTPYAPG